MRKNSNKGITLIALVITVIVLLILAGTAISIALSGDNIFTKANTAVNAANAKAIEQTDNILALEGNFDVYYSSYNSSQAPGEAPTPTELSMELDGEQVTGINQTNFGQYLGKVVTKYKNAASSKTSVTNDDGTFNVGTTYRLYWIDWTNKYGDGAGTIYLKADVYSGAGTKNYKLCDSSYTLYNGALETAENTTSKLKNLNPALGDTTAITGQNNMWVVRWLTDPSKWSGLKTNTYEDYTNYVVGAPSLEMMMDSYNAHYASVLTTGENDTPDTTNNFSSVATRPKLFYKYTSGGYGYQVGPQGTNEYSTYTSNYAVKTDPSIDGMYYPGSGNYYWLASPSAGASNLVMIGTATSGGRVATNYCTTDNAFCPLVSLQSDVSL